MLAGNVIFVIVILLLFVPTEFFFMHVFLPFHYFPLSLLAATKNSAIRQIRLTSYLASLQSKSKPQLYVFDTLTNA